MQVHPEPLPVPMQVLPAGRKAKQERKQRVVRKDQPEPSKLAQAECLAYPALRVDKMEVELRVVQVECQERPVAVVTVA